MEVTMRRSKLLSLIFITVAAVAVAGCSGESSPGEDTGSLNLELELADGVTISEVDWVISGGDMAPMSGTIDTSAPGATASVEVFGLPPAEGYLVELEATDENSDLTCKGDAEFDVEVGRATDIGVMLNCKRPTGLGGVRVNGEFNICAQLAKAVVSPLQTSVGNDIALSAQGEDVEGDAISYEWSATGGSIANAGAQQTTYTCGVVGTHSVTISVSDDGGVHCTDEWTVPVTCEDGDGGAGGTGGDGGVGGMGGMPEGACTNEADGAVYDALAFVDGKGQASSGTDAASAIASECVRGSVSSTPPVAGCGAELSAIIGCATARPPNCPPEKVQAVATCVENCTQDTISQITGDTLSNACAECYGANAACGVAECAVECVADAAAPICVNCRADQGCTPEFEACSGGSGGSGGTAPPCNGPACLFCPASALDPTVGALYPDGLNVPIPFGAFSNGPVIRGETTEIFLDASGAMVYFPVPVTATIAAGHTSTYQATSGGSGVATIPVPGQTVTGSDLFFDVGVGSGAFTPGSNATDMVVRLTSTVIDMTITEPLLLPVLLDASPSGPCEMTGVGVTIPVVPPAPTCDDPACLFCPATALDPTVGALFPDGLLVPIHFTAVPDQPLVQGVTESVTMSATSVLGPLPVAVAATVSAASSTTYEVVAGGSGTADIPVPTQTVAGMTLTIDAGTGGGAFTPDGDATDVVVRLTSAVFDATITDPITLPLVLDASPTGSCVMLGDGVSLMVDPL